MTAGCSEKRLFGNDAALTATASCLPAGEFCVTLADMEVFDMETKEILHQLRTEKGLSQDELRKRYL